MNVTIGNATPLVFCLFAALQRRQAALDGWMERERSEGDNHRFRAMHLCAVCMCVIESERVCACNVCLDVKDSSDSCQKVKCDEGGSVSSRNKLY